MGSLSKKAYKGLPVGIKVRKPHYYYQDFLEVFNDNTEKYIELREFEGLDYSFNRSQVTFDEKVLWNGYTFSGCERLLAPSGEDYLTSVKKLVYNVVGSPVVVDGVASGFSGSKYIQIPNAFKPANESWEFVLKLTLTTNTTLQRLAGCVGGYYKTFGTEISASGIVGVGITSNGSSWNVCWMNGITALQVGIPYWIKVSFTGTQYKLELSTDGVEYTLENSKDSTALLYQQNDSIINIGYMGTETAKYFQGSIDLNESYIKIGSKYVWGKEAENVISARGCLDNITDVPTERVLTAFVKDDEIILSENSDDREGYIWANKVTIPQHEVIPVYKKKFSETNTNYKYTYQDENILVSLNPSGELVLSEPLVFNFIPPTTFFDYDVRFTAKVTPVDATSLRVICKVPSTSWWFGTDGGKLCMYKSLTADAALTANTTYWVRMAETYSVSTGQYIHRIAYIIDNGYTKETLPDESEWVVKTLTNTTPWFGSESTITNFGWIGDSYSWFGTMDLTNIWVDYGNITNIGDNTRIYETKWEMLEKV